jgi:hypothetical protein
VVIANPEFPKQPRHRLDWPQVADLARVGTVEVPCDQGHRAGDVARIALLTCPHVDEAQAGIPQLPREPHWPHQQDRGERGWRAA